VDLCALALQQGGIDGVLNQSVLEGVDCVWRFTLNEREFTATKAIEMFVKLFIGNAGDRVDERIREVPPDGCSKLGDALAFAKAIEASHERSVNGRRKEPVVERAHQLVAVGIQAQGS